MGVRHQGFALMIVMIAIAAVFAIALRGAVVARSTRLEVGAIHSRVVAERYARAAVIVAVQGLIPVGDAEARDRDDAFANSAPGEGVGVAEPPSAPAGDEGEGIELPAFLKELIPSLAEVEEKAKGEASKVDQELARVADGRAMTGRVPQRREGVKARLDKVGLPPGPVRVEIEGRAFRIRMWDATGLLNVNRAEQDQLIRYFTAKGTGTGRATELAEQILDWRDTDSIPRSRGAEQPAYDRLGVVCRNSEFLSLEELMFLPAMDQALFDAIEDELAIGGDGLIHVGSAPAEVLATLPGLDDDAVSGLMALRGSGSLDEESLARVLPIMHRDDILQRVRIKSSGILRLRVEALEGETDRVTARFDGLAFVSETGIQEVGLRPM